MSYLKSLTLVALTVAAPYLLARPARADIYRWDNGQLIPGTEGITPGPGVQLDHRQLEYVNLGNKNLAGANFEWSNLTSAWLESSTLLDANLRGADLTNANLWNSWLANADLSGAVVKGAQFPATEEGSNFTKEQLYSTQSYKAKNLSGIRLGGFELFPANDLSGWNFREQNLTNADFSFSALTDAVLTGAVVAGASFAGTTRSGFTREQLYSTASYKAKELQGISLLYNDLGGWDFSGQNLQNVVWQTPDGSPNVNLTNAILSGADTRGDFFGGLLTYWLGNGDWRHAILPDGTIAGLQLVSDALAVRNYHVPEACGLCALLPVTIMEQMTVAERGGLELRFDTDPWHSLISFEAGITVQLGGTLELTFADDVDITTQIGRTLHVFDWTGVSPTGAFTVDSDYLWDLSNLYTSGEITLVSALTGDTNGDGQIGLDDLNNVRNHFGLTGEPGLPGDAIPFDGVVDLDDLNAVRNNFGAAQPSTAIVPEPSGWMLAMATCLAASLTRRRTLRIGQGCFAICVAVLCAGLASRPVHGGFRVGPEINVSSFGILPKWSPDSTKFVFNNYSSDVIPSGDAGTET